MTCGESVTNCRPKPRVAPGLSPNSLVNALATLSRVLVAITARALASVDVDITLPQYRTLVLLAARGSQRNVDLARELGVHPSTMTRTCDRLIRRGLLRREHFPSDRRVAWLALTEQGKDLLCLVTWLRNQQISSLVEQAGISDSEAASQVLDALVNASGELSETQWWQRWSEPPPDRAPAPVTDSPVIENW